MNYPILADGTINPQSITLLNQKLDQILGFLTEMDKKINILGQRQEFLGQQIETIKTKTNSSNGSESNSIALPRKRFCHNDRRMFHDQPEDDYCEHKRKRPLGLKQKTDALKTIHHEDLDEKEKKDREKWLEMQKIKYVLNQIEIEKKQQAIDQHHLSYLN